MKLIIDIDEDYVKIINKNGASNYPEEVIKNSIPLDDVLDKIRVEIQEELKQDNHSFYRAALKDVIKIIDRYKGKQK